MTAKLNRALGRAGGTQQDGHDGDTNGGTTGGHGSGPRQEPVKGAGKGTASGPKRPPVGGGPGAKAKAPYRDSTATVVAPNKGEVLLDLQAVFGVDSFPGRILQTRMGRTPFSTAILRDLNKHLLKIEEKDAADKATALSKQSVSLNAIARMAKATRKRVTVISGSSQSGGQSETEIRFLPFSKKAAIWRDAYHAKRHNNKKCDALNYFTRKLASGGYDVEEAAVLLGLEVREQACAQHPADCEWDANGTILPPSMGSTTTSSTTATGRGQCKAIASWGTLLCRQYLATQGEFGEKRLYEAGVLEDLIESLDNIESGDSQTVFLRLFLDAPAIMLRMEDDDKAKRLQGEAKIIWGVDRDNAVWNFGNCLVNGSGGLSGLPDEVLPAMLKAGGAPDGNS